MKLVAQLLLGQTQRQPCCLQALGKAHHAHSINGDQVEGASELKSKYDAQVRNDAEAQLLKGYRRLSVKRRQGLLAMID